MLQTHLLLPKSIKTIFQLLLFFKHFGFLSQYSFHRIMEYSELEGTHKSTVLYRDRTHNLSFINTML